MLTLVISVSVVDLGLRNSVFWDPRSFFVWQIPLNFLGNYLLYSTISRKFSFVIFTQFKVRSLLVCDIIWAHLVNITWIVFSISYKKNGVNLGPFVESKSVLKEDFAAVRIKTPIYRKTESIILAVDCWNNNNNRYAFF